MWPILLNLAVDLFLIGVLLWLLLRFVLPVWCLNKMVRRIEEGEAVRAWEVEGAAPIRSAAQAIENLGRKLDDCKSKAASYSERLEIIFRESESGIAVANQTSLILQMNRSFSRIFNLPEESEGKRLIDLLQIFEINQAVSHAKTSGDSVKVDVTFKVIQGDVLVTRNVGFFVEPLREGKKGEYLLIAIDYSRLREMESQERQMVGNVSHELRTPLSVFKGYLEALEEAERDGKPETRRMISVLNRHSKRLNHLVEDLLMLSSLEEGDIKPEWENVHMEKFFDRLVRDCRHFLDEGNSLEWRVADGVDLVSMDEFRIEQVFHNLIDNARRHSESRKPIRVGVLKNEESKEFHFFVRDEGRGIPSDQLEHVFRRFYRIDRARSRERGGTGLGLTIVQEIVQAHGGRAWIESSFGEGTTAWFSIPPRPPERKRKSATNGAVAA